MKDCDEHTPRAIFARYGYAPTSLGELNDRQVPGRLWELHYAAAARRFFFCLTDHLNDRDFYTLLWEEWLDEPSAYVPPTAETNTHLMVFELNANGMTPRGNLAALLRQRDEERAQATRDYPENSIPPNEEPSCDRVWRLPRGAF